MGRYFAGTSATCAWGGSGCADISAAFLRGGYRTASGDTGVFALSLAYGRDYQISDFGFRCAGP
jgi:hypothetical protein